MKALECIEAFEDYLLEEEKSPATIKGYVADAEHFLNSIKKKNLKDINRTDINAYKDQLKKKGLKVQTINRKLVSIKQLIDFLNDRFKFGISARIKQEKVQEQYALNDEELLLKEDYKRLIEATEKHHDIRAKAIFEAMCLSGMRVSEMLQLRVDHVENDLKTIHDIKGKGGKYRKIFISSKLRNTLREYLAVRKIPYAMTAKSTNILFLGERGPITRQTAHTLIKKYAKVAGIPETKAHVHNLRHLFGLNLADQGVPIQDIAKFMGHTSIDVTKIYLEKTQSYYEDQIEELSSL